MPRVYAVRILGNVDQTILDNITTGVALEDGTAAFDHIESVGGTGVNQWYHVTLREGRQREVRRLWESQGVRVSRLIRIAFGPLKLPRNLPAGRFRDLNEQEIASLYAAVDHHRPPIHQRNRFHRRSGGNRSRPTGA